VHDDGSNNIGLKPLRNALEVTWFVAGMDNISGVTVQTSCQSWCNSILRLFRLTSEHIRWLLYFVLAERGGRYCECYCPVSSHQRASWWHSSDKIILRWRTM